jgi:MarR family transcriptional regulator, transcriptional regulator for hemolysin
MEEHLAYLISDTGRMIRKAFDERARTIGITRPQWRVLAWLRRQPGIKQAPLSELLEVEPISLSRMIDRLQESGLVERRPDPADRRAWCLYLTDKADPIVESLRSLVDSLHTDMMHDIAPSEDAILRRLLLQMRENLQQGKSLNVKNAVNG